MTAFAATVLAGGQSRRMGRDKALLAHPQTQEPLWQRQVTLLESLSPTKLWLSLNATQTLETPLPIVRDHHAEIGPLGGLLSSLEALGQPLLITLAVDMLAMTKEPLRQLLDQCQDDCGAVFQEGKFFHPTAAVYPRAALPAVRAFHAAGERRLQDLIRILISDGLLNAVPLPEAQASCFANFNTPADLATLT